MKLSLSKEIEYIPEWNDNKKEADPIIAIFRHLTTDQRNDCMDTGFDKNNKMIIKPDLGKIFRWALVELKNLDIDDEMIKTANDVLKKPGLYNLFMELALYALNMDALESKKN